MKMKKNLVVLLSMLVLTMGYFKGYCANGEADKTPVKKAWELGTRFTTDPGLYLKWYNDLEKRLVEQEDKPLDDVIIEFKKLIDSDPIVRMNLTEMIDQAKPKPGSSSLETPYLKDVDDMLKKIDAVTMYIGGSNPGMISLPGNLKMKGVEPGYFQFGGSTYCLIFRPGVIKEFTVQKDARVNMGAQIAVAN